MNRVDIGIQKLLVTEDPRESEFNCYILFILSCCTKSRSLLDLLLCKFAFWVLSMWLGRFDSHIIVVSLFVSKKYYWIEMLSFFIFSLKVNWTFITWVFFSILFNLRSISWSLFFSYFIKFFHDNLSANFSRSPAGQNSFPSIRCMNNLFIYFWFLLTIYFMINIDLFSLSSEAFGWNQVSTT